jgi:hypothetical protein
MPIPFLVERQRCVDALVALARRSQWSNIELHWHATQIDRYYKNLATFERRMAKPNQRRTHRLRHCLLTSYSGVLCAFLLDAGSRGTKRIKPRSTQQLEKFLRSTCPTRPLIEHAVIKTQTKANGEKRITLSPGPKVRTAQRLVSDVLDASGVANPFDYSRAGKGRDAAIAEIIRLVEEDGIRDFVVFDLKNYFTSVEAKHLKGFLLPKEVLRHSVQFNRHAILLYTSCTAAEAETARQGLPQGARVSGLLASALLGRELRQLDGAMGIVTYVDDGVVGACDPTGAKSLAEAIKLRFGKHPGGPLSFKKLDVDSIERGFQFLGYWLRLDPSSEQPNVVARPSHEGRERFRRNLVHKLRAISPRPDWDTAVEVAQAYGRCWRAAFSHWQPGDEEIYEFEGVVEIFVGDFLSGFPGKHGLKPPVLACVG